MGLTSYWRTASYLRAAASRPTRRCAASTSDKGGSVQGFAAPHITPETASGQQWLSAHRAQGSGTAAMLPQSTSTLPETGDLQVTDIMPRRSYPIGITVNSEGRRFVDEGASFAEQTFVDMGHAILQQEDGIAYQVFDSRAQAHLEGRYSNSRRFEASTVSELAEKLGIDAEELEKTVHDFNASAHDAGYEPRTLDGRSTSDLDPPKSNWAIRIDQPPYFAYTVTGGITYTYGGLKIDTGARVLNTERPAHIRSVCRRDHRWRDIRAWEPESRRSDARCSLWQDRRDSGRDWRRCLEQGAHVPSSQSRL